MDLDELRDALDEAGRRTPVDPMPARSAVDARTRHLRRRNRSVMLVALAAVVAAVVGAFGLAHTNADGRLRIQPSGPAPDSVVPSTVPATTNQPTTVPPSTAPGQLDPLPAGSAMLGITGGTISVLDAQGHKLETLVTYSDFVVTNVQMTPDHRTIFYALRAPDARSACPSVMKLDLKRDLRTIVGTADDFALTPDGRKIVLVFPRSNASIVNNCQPVPFPSGVSIYAGALVERDLVSGGQWTLPLGDEHLSAGTGGPYGHVFINDEGNTLFTTNCVEEGCFANGYSVPVYGTGDISYRAAGPTCGCPTFVSAVDGVYGVDIGGSGHPQYSVRRYSWDRLQGSGTVIATSNVALGSSVAPTSAGVFVIGSGNLYRVDNGNLQLVAPTTAQQIFSIPPFAGS
jgi:hypothetical protein